MLKHKANDLLHLLSILESIEKIRLYSKDSESAEIFFEYNDQINFNATLTLLMHIGETVGKLSDDLLENSPEIPWEKYAVYGIESPMIILLWIWQLFLALSKINYPIF